MWGAEEVDTATRTSRHHPILGPEVHISLVPPFLCDGELPGGLRVWRIIKLGVNFKGRNQGTWIKLPFINSNKRWYLCHVAIVPAQDIGLKLANPLPAWHHFQSVSFPGCISFLFHGETLWWLELEGIQPSELRRPPHQNSEVKWFTCEWRRWIFT